MATPNVHWSSKSHEWPTPQFLFDALNAEFGFTLDPCCTTENAKCAKRFTAKENGLAQSWEGEHVFMNPPYGKEIWRWMARALSASRNENALVVCLVPARTDTAWWHDYAMRGEIRFLRGRLKFNGKKDAPFPSAIVIFKPTR